MLNISLSPEDNLVSVLSILTPFWYMTSNTRTSKSRMTVSSSLSKTMNEHGREDTVALLWGREAEWQLLEMRWATGKEVRTLVSMRGEALVKKRCCHVKALPREHRKVLNDKMVMTAKLICTILNLKVKNIIMYDYLVHTHEAMLENEAYNVRRLILNFICSKFFLVWFNTKNWRFSHPIPSPFITIKKFGKFCNIYKSQPSNL